MLLAEVLSNLLFWFPVLALALLSAVFLWRRIWLELPLFFLYIVSASFVGLLRYAAFPVSRSLYFYVYWISELELAMVFSLALYEVFLRRLFPGFHKVRLYRVLFPGTAAMVLILTIIAALQSADKPAAFLLASRIFDFVRTAFLVFFMLLMLLMGRQWPRYDLGITLGFGIQAAAALANAAVALASAAVRVRLGHTSTMFGKLEVITFEIACVIWLITFIKPERPVYLESRAALDPAMLQEARKWETVLKDWLSRKDVL